MNDFIRLDPSDSILHFDATTALPDLAACAGKRINAGKELLKSMTCIHLNDADSQDLAGVCNAAYMLIEDGSQMLGLVEQILQRERASAA